MSEGIHEQHLRTLGVEHLCLDFRGVNKVCGKLIDMFVTTSINMNRKCIFLKNIDVYLNLTNFVI